MTDELMEDLEVSCMDAIRGDPPGPSLAKRLERTVRVVLDRHGMQSARLEVTSTRARTEVTLLLPKPDRTVERVVLHLG